MFRKSFFLLLFLPLTARAAAPSRQAVAFFENSVRPLLVQHCIKCHGPVKQESSLRLDTEAGFSKGGDLGPLVKGKDIRASLLIKAVGQTGDLKMPPDKRLSAREIGILEKWVKLGSPWPRGAALAKTKEGGAKIRGGKITKQERAFWSFQRIKRPPLPSINNPGWATNEIDYFVQAKLQASGLKPVPAADRSALLRRVTYDLTGLPPTPEELQHFLLAQSPAAYERVVDRLLASAAYGERWGRHWLDVVRYADTAGETADYPVPQAYVFRNWVVRAFNADKPYDEFVREQIAGDIIANRTKANPQRFRELVTATGFVAISRRFGFNISGYHNLTIQDTIDTVGQAMLGLSLGCARCHDHKYDPVNKEDYYAWYGIFSSTRYSYPGCENSKRPKDFAPVIPLAEADKRQAMFKTRMAFLTKEIAQLTKSVNMTEARLKSLAPYLAGRAGGDSWNPFVSSIEARLLPRHVPNQGNHRGFHVWLPRSGDLPVVGINASKKRLRVPGDVEPQMVVFHPTNTGGVAIAWRSPFSGRVRVTGQVADAHRNCGDSVAWQIAQLGKKGFRPLAQGSLSKTRQEKLNSPRHKRLGSIAVSKGDFLQFSIVPQSSYGCDLTSLYMTVEELSGKRRRWDLSNDISRALDKSQTRNPVLDARGKPAWYLYAVPLHRGKTWAATIAKVTDIKKARAEAQALSVRLTDSRRRLAALKEEQTRRRKEGAFPVVYGVVEGTIGDAPIQRRGNKRDLGAKVVRRNLAILGGQKIESPQQNSGRLDLANWLTKSTNPLTARVMANRIWQHHFGIGLVGTENDFGARGERPSHPQLLDWLADYFVTNGWSVKRLHRKILLSTTYRLSSDYSATAAKLDPDARLLWRFKRRRLSAEEYRDSLLHLAAALDRSVGGEHPFPPPERWSYSQHAPFYGLYQTDRRSIYLMQQRLKRHPFLALFDGADPNVSTARRSHTTTPTQALYLMNDSFVHRCSTLFAERIATKVAGNRERIRAAYEMALSRLPTTTDLAPATQFLTAYQQRLQKLGRSKTEAAKQALAGLIRTLLVRNEFLFVD